MVSDAQRVEDAGELDRDVAAADHHQMLGPLAQVLERVVGSDRVLDPGLIGQARPAADRDHDALGAMELGRSTSTSCAPTIRPRALISWTPALSSMST